MADVAPSGEGTLFLTELLYHLTQVERHLGAVADQTEALANLRVRNLLNETIARALLCALRGETGNPDLVAELFRIAGPGYARELNWALERAIKLE
jgi:hypothetical protein